KIAEAIIDCVVGISPPLLIDTKYDGYDERLLLLVPLLGVCHSLRTIVYSRYCQEYEIHLGYVDDPAAITCCLWPPSLREPENTEYSLAKELRIVLDIWEVIEGKVLEMLQCIFDPGSVFSMARTFSLQF
ncbi:hypothetical protein IWW39_006014, partial [Coemansia spiralis]